MRFHLPLPLCRQQGLQPVGLAVAVREEAAEAVVRAAEQGLRLPKAEHPRPGLLLQAPVLLLAPVLRVAVLRVPEAEAVEAEAAGAVEAGALLRRPHPQHLYNLWTFV